MNPDLDPRLVGALFAPVPAQDAVAGVLSEGQAVLARVSDPVDAELWASDVIGALARTAGGPPGAMAVLAEKLVPAAQEASTPEALAMLRVFAVLGSEGLRTAAGTAAGKLTAAGTEEPAWAHELGSPVTGECWHYADVTGRQESVMMTFGYGDRQHVLSVLIDHGQGGRMKDVWVDKAAGQLEQTRLAAVGDPLVVFEMIDADDARDRLDKAIHAGECPQQSDQADALAAHRALLDFLAGTPDVAGGE